MERPTTPVVFYASAIVVKAVTDEKGTLFEMDIEIAGSWASTRPLPRNAIETIRAATCASNPAGIEFEAEAAQDGSAIRFLVDCATRVQDEWSFC